MLDIKITRTTSPKEKPDENNLGFGKKFTDHMFVMDYTEGEGWHDARIVPYGPFELDPATVVFHYAQEIFEGMKAYRTADDTVQLFRPDCNAKRFQDSADRLCIPKIPVEDYIQAVETLVDVDELVPGMVTAGEVRTKGGQLIVENGASLTDRLISRIKFYAIPQVSVTEDPIPATKKEEQVEVPSHVVKPEAQAPSYSQKVVCSKEFQNFQISYSRVIATYPRRHPNRSSSRSTRGRFHPLREPSQTVYGRCRDR